MLLDIEHTLECRYDQYISESCVELRVEPQTTEHQTVHTFFLAVGPPAKVFRFVDWNQNWVHHFSIPSYHDKIEVTSRSLVDTHPAHPALDAVTHTGPIAEASGPMLHYVSFGGPVLDGIPMRSLAAQINVPADAPLGAQIQAIGALTAERVVYIKDITDYRSTTDHALEHCAGVCQDLAHVMLGLLRTRRIPCRYVSGYLEVEAGGARPPESHAWVEVFTPTHGWVGYDPTHTRVPDERYVSVARGRHYNDVPPNRGNYRGKAKETIQAKVHIKRSDKTGLLGLHEEIGQIDLPVYSEIPTKKSPVAQLPDQAAEQQQQQ